MSGSPDSVNLRFTGSRADPSRDPFGKLRAGCEGRTNDAFQQPASHH